MRMAMIAGLLAMMTTTGAVAQQASDVVVMRRTIALGNISLYEWDAGDPILGAPSCSAAAPVTYDVQCVDRSTRAPVSRSLCHGRAPLATGTLEDRRACTYDWSEGGYQPWPSLCGQSATKTQTVTCVRLGSGVAEPMPDETACLALRPKPATQETQTITTACAHAWQRTSSVCEKDQPFRTEVHECRRTHPNGHVEILTGTDAASFCGEMPATRVPDSECTGLNLIANGDFEGGTTGWTSHGSRAMAITDQGVSKGSSAARPGSHTSTSLLDHPAGTYEVSFTYVGSGRFWAYIGTNTITWLFNGGASASTVTQYKRTVVLPAQGGYFAFEDPENNFIVDNVAIRRVAD